MPNSYYRTVLWPGLCGLSATLIGHGIGRFAFVALMPGIIAQQWFSEAMAGYLQSSTLLGYLFGGFTAHWLSEKFGSQRMIKLSMLSVAFAYLSCFTPFSYGWFLVCRFVVGVAGAWLIIVSPAFIFHRTPHEVKGSISGMIFAGIGVGVVIAGALIPLLTGISLSATWVGLGLAALGFTLITWRYWHSDNIDDAAMDQPSAQHYRLADNKRHAAAVILLLIAYALDATGYLPHTIYWVNFIVHDLNMSLAQGSFYWTLFGVGAVIGPFIVGRCGDWIGLNVTLILAFLLKSMAVFLPDFYTDNWALVVSSLMVGGLTTGTVTLVSAVTLEIVGRQYHKQVWGWMTTSFALAQAVMGYGIVYLFNMTQNYSVLFYLGGTCLFAAALICIEIRRLLR